MITAISAAEAVARTETMKPANELLLSVVTPVYNEEEVVDRLASEILAAVSTRRGPWEVIIKPAKRQPL